MLRCGTFGQSSVISGRRFVVQMTQDFMFDNINGTTGGRRDSMRCVRRLAFNQGTIKFHTVSLSLTANGYISGLQQSSEGYVFSHSVQKEGPCTWLGHIPLPFVQGPSLAKLSKVPWPQTPPFVQGPSPLDVFKLVHGPLQSRQLTLD